MSEVPLYSQHGCHACNPTEAVSEQDPRHDSFTAEVAGLRKVVRFTCRIYTGEIASNDIHLRPGGVGAPLRHSKGMDMYSGPSLVRSSTPLLGHHKALGIVLL